MLRLMSRHNSELLRIQRLRLHLQPAPPLFLSRSSSEGSPGASGRCNGGSGESGESGEQRTIDIAGVVGPLASPARPELVPRGFVDRILGGAGEFSHETLAHLRWMRQKVHRGGGLLSVGHGAVQGAAEWQLP